MRGMKKKVTEIELPKQPGSTKLQHVCAYVRVSTGHDAQLISLQAQTEYYEQQLSNRPNCIFVGIYSDEGISGMKADRPQFKAMMTAAAEGKIDLIVTKSISRFARNSLLFLKSVRALKEIGVCVYFEKENIYSISKEGELMMSLYAVFAEEERKQVCSNVRWSIRKKYEAGHSLLNPSRVYGFDEGTGGEWVINEDQAAVIQYIYDRYNEGFLPGEIAAKLNADEVPTGTNHPWSDSRVLRIIRNEKYKGDCLLQKTYVDYRGVAVINNGVYSKFFVENHNPAIISAEVWAAANIRASKRKQKVYPFSSRLHCPYCGAVMIRSTSQWGVKWQCATYRNKGKAFCPGLWLPDTVLTDIAGVEHEYEHWTVQEKIDGNEKSYTLIPFSRV